MMARLNAEKEDPEREVAPPNRAPGVSRYRKNRSATDESPDHSYLWLSALLLMVLSLLCGHVTWAEDSPCQGWGTTTFVYEADVVEACLNADIDLNAGINRTGTTPLIGAVQLGDSDAVWLLLAAGANPNKQDRQGWTPLMFAAQAGHPEIVRQLAKAGADPHLRNDAGQTALLLALDQEQTAMVGPLVAAGATIDAATLIGLVEQGQQRGLAALAARGVSLDIRLAGGETLLMVAAEQGHQTIVEQLLADGLDPTRTAENGATALLRAAEAGHRDLVTYFLRFEPDNGTGALYWAAKQGWSGAVEQLLALGVDPNTTINFSGSSSGLKCTPLYEAAAGGHAAIVPQLLAAGADRNYGCINKEGAIFVSPLLAGVSHPAVVEQLIRAGADVNFQQPGYGTTALMRAAEGGHLASVEALLVANADVNLREQHVLGATALTEAAKAGHCEIVIRLVAAKADVRIRERLILSDKRLTALEFAERGAIRPVPKLCAPLLPNAAEAGGRAGNRDDEKRERREEGEMSVSKHLILIHGRHFKPAKNVLKANWYDAIRHGLDRDGHKNLLPTYDDNIKRTFVYYGDLSNAFLSKHGSSYDETEDVKDREECLDRLKKYPREAFLGERGKRNYENLAGASSWKERLADMLGGGASILRIADPLIGMVAKDIAHYWDPDTAFGSDVRWRLTEPLNKALCDGDDIMLVSHSLGTMISYDVLWKFSYYGEYKALRETRNKLNTLVTLGSPLGDKTVMKNLKGSGISGSRRYPTLIRTWENFAAEDDYISYDETLTDDYENMQHAGLVNSVCDHRLYNLAVRHEKSNPHHGVGYLIHPKFITLAREMAEAGRIGQFSVTTPPRLWRPASSLRL